MRRKGEVMRRREGEKEGEKEDKGVRRRIDFVDGVVS